MRNQWIEFTGKGQVDIREAEQELTPQPGHVLLQAEYSAISPGTELSRLHEMFLPRPELQSQPLKYPVKPGYAMVGRVIVSADRSVPVGQRLLARCPHARYNLVDLRPRNHWCVAPESMSPADAAIAPLAQIAMTAPLSIDTRPGHRVLVIGLGVIGYLAQQWFINSAALEAHGCDMRDDRLSFAAERGATAFPADHAAKQARSKPYDIVVEATGSTPGIHAAFAAVRDGGAVLLLGTAREKLNDFDITNAIHRRFVTVVGIHINRHDRPAAVGPAMPPENTLETALNFIHAGRIKVNGLIGRTFPATQAAQAYAAIPAENLYTAGLDWTGA